MNTRHMHHWSIRSVITAIITLLLIGCQTQTNFSDTQSKPVVSATASKEVTETALDVIEAVREWLSAQNTSGSVAVSHQGKLIAKQGFGRDPDTAYPVASLSKAITAVCIQQTLATHQSTADLTLAEAVPMLLLQHPPVDQRLRAVTIAQLMSHNSGIHSVFHRDYIADNRAYSRFDMKEQFKALSRETMAANPGSGYHYSNANHLLLGLAIEEIAGQPYEDHCRKTTLEPAGVDADMNPQWRVMSSWGGWRLSAADYLKFLHSYFLDINALDTPSGAIRPEASVGNGAYYTYGVFTRQVTGGARFWHAGAWRWRNPFRNDQFGAYFITREDGLMVSVNYATSAQDQPLQNLQQLLIQTLNL